MPAFEEPWTLEERQRFVVDRLREHRREEEARRAEAEAEAAKCCRGCCGFWSVLFGGRKRGGGQE